MHPKLPQLLSDILAAHQLAIPDLEYPKEGDPDFDEKWHKYMMRHTAPLSFSYICGLKQNQFPPAEVLTEPEMIVIIDMYKRMMKTWNHSLQLPAALPLAVAYKFMVQSLASETQYADDYPVKLDFCEGYPVDCVFKEYCECTDLWNAMLHSSYDERSTDLFFLKLKQFGIGAKTCLRINEREFSESIFSELKMFFKDRVIEISAVSTNEEIDYLAGKKNKNQLYRKPDDDEPFLANEPDGFEVLEKENESA